MGKASRGKQRKLGFRINTEHPIVKLSHEIAIQRELSFNAETLLTMLLMGGGISGHYPTLNTDFLELKNVPPQLHEANMDGLNELKDKAVVLLIDGGLLVLNASFDYKNGTYILRNQKGDPQVPPGL